MPLKITTDAAPLLKTGTIEILDASDRSVVESIDVSKKTATRTIGGVDKYNYYPVIISGNEATIFPAKMLGYGKTYEVKIAAGALGDSVVVGEWQFTTKFAPPAANAAKLTIAADGTGDFCTVQGAMDFLPDGNVAPISLLLRPGVYTELISVSNKHSITLLGEDRKKSVIEYADNAKLNPAGGPYRRGVLLVNKCNDFTLANLTIRNTSPYKASQAETIIFNGSVTAHAIVSHVDLYSFQDTLQINGQAYIDDCYVEGDVDFLWGTGPCFFENCICHSVNSKAYYTQIRNPPANHGYVFHKCTFDGGDKVTGNFLSRIQPSRFPASEVVLIDCTMTSSVGAAAWRLDGGTDPAQVHFWEYNSHTPDGAPVDTSGRAKFSKQLTMADDAKTIADYSDPVFVLGNEWKPKAPEGLK